MPPEYWDGFNVPSQSKGASKAIKNIWDEPNLYGFRCTGMARHTLQRAAIDVLGEDEVDEQLEFHTYHNEDNICKKISEFPNIDENGMRPWQHENNCKWIPGDWGYIRNPNGKDENAGENIWYLGGCWSMDPNNFLNNARFWGHIPGTVRNYRLIRWFIAVDEMDGQRNNNSYMFGYRKILKQPPGEDD